MKLLTVIRHAKSSWQQPDVDDFDRPLNPRGLRDAPEMGRRLAAAGEGPEEIVSSPALRARQTADAIVRELGGAPEAIRFEPALYLAAPQQMLEIVRGLPPSAERAALVGHNPGTTAFLGRLVDGLQLDDVPTCGVARLQLDVARWGEADWGCAQLLDFDYPKRLGPRSRPQGEID